MLSTLFSHEIQNTLCQLLGRKGTLSQPKPDHCSHSEWHCPFLYIPTCLQPAVAFYLLSILEKHSFLFWIPALTSLQYRHRLHGYVIYMTGKVIATQNCAGRKNTQWFSSFQLFQTRLLARTQLRKFKTRTNLYSHLDWQLFLHQFFEFLSFLRST